MLTTKQTKNMNLSAISNHWVSHCLHEGDYVFWNSVNEFLEIHHISYLERVWRTILSWTGLCDSTTKKCALLSLATLNVFCAQAPFHKINFSASLQMFHPEIAKTCCELWQSSAIQWMNHLNRHAIKIPPEAKHLMFIEAHRWHLSSLSDQVSKIVDSGSTDETASAISITHLSTPLSLHALQTYPYLHIDSQELSHLQEILSTPCGEAIRTKSIFVSIPHLTWPNRDLQIHSSSAIPVLPIHVESLTITNADDYKSICEYIKINPQLRRIKFESGETPKLLHESIAQALFTLDHLEFVDFGNFTSPLTLDKFPRCLCKVSAKQSPPLTSSVMDCPINWTLLENPNTYLGPRTLIKSPNGEQTSLPFGFLRRVSAKFHQEPAEVVNCKSTNEYNKLIQLLKISAGKSPLPSEQDVVDLILTGYEWNMGPIIRFLLSEYKLLYYHSACLEKLSQPPVFQTICPDMFFCFDTDATDASHTIPEIGVDRFLLSITHPSRLKTLKDVHLMEHVHIKENMHVHAEQLGQYYSPEPTKIDLKNCEAFWDLSLKFQNNSCLKKVLDFINEQMLKEQKIVFSKDLLVITLERWLEFSRRIEKDSAKFQEISKDLVSMSSSLADTLGARLTAAKQQRTAGSIPASSSPLTPLLSSSSIFVPSISLKE